MKKRFAGTHKTLRLPKSAHVLERGFLTGPPDMPDIQYAITFNPRDHLCFAAYVTPPGSTQWRGICFTYETFRVCEDAIRAFVEHYIDKPTMDEVNS